MSPSIYYLSCSVLLCQVNEGTNVVLQHNIVAGYERVAYRIDGEPCPGNATQMFITKISNALLVSGYIAAVCERQGKRCSGKFPRDIFISSSALCRLFEQQREVD